MAEITLQIDGMHCGSCIRRVTQTINATGNNTVSEVRLGAARFTASDTESAEATAAPVIAALAKAGFAARVEA
ncbi:heavy-metal-associated domain-containing protein [Acidicapsa ligni]|uniref:heavy-metal-associated domain-containing protein n=1 Tax=Acidicapsa ligni TaxID=542300 RepID=UPI0021DFB97C|nr:heavy-metal-associated domain-containing protein [Acidicapsa ligni]